VPDVEQADLAAGLATGALWMRVPDTIRVDFTGMTGRMSPATSTSLSGSNDRVAPVASN
jgi:homoaconitase/3-isopropylmalate dehydratase large subunit